jgi:hypothetical protein
MKVDRTLASTHPDLAAEAFGWDPQLVSSFSGKKLSWKCKAGHVFDATVANRTFNDSKCPYCSGSKVLAGFNDLKTLFPELALEAFEWDPTTLTAGSGLKVKWKCSLGHIWTVSPNQRTSRKSNCPFCSNNKVWPGFNDLKTLLPEIASEADGWNPEEVSPKSSKNLDWKCKLGHSWKAKPADRSRGDQCPYCSGKRVLSGFNDLSTTHPSLADEAQGWNPTEVSFGSNKSVVWRCKLGHEWKASPNSRTNKDSGCPYCVNQLVLAGFNDFATTHPQLASQLVGSDPKKFTYGSNRKVKWRCEFGHEWTVSPAVRTGKGGTNCPSCADSGFDPNEQAWLYFLTHPDWEMLQIGITNSPDVRLEVHSRLGWEVIEVRGPMMGDVAKGWEQAILGMIRSRGIPLGKSNHGEKFTGYTESWLREFYNPNNIRTLMKDVEEQES